MLIFFRILFRKLFLNVGKNLYHLLLNVLPVNEIMAPQKHKQCNKFYIHLGAQYWLFRVARYNFITEYCSSSACNIVHALVVFKSIRSDNDMHLKTRCLCTRPCFEEASRLLPTSSQHTLLKHLLDKNEG